MRFGRAEKAELSSLLTLAGPLIIAHAGTQLMSVVDTAMVGRLGAAALGGVGIGNGIFFSLTLLGMGCVLGMDALAAQAIGAGEERLARRVLWQGLRVALLVGVPLSAAVALTPLLLPACGVDALTAHEVTWYLLGRTPNVIPFFLFAALRSYLQAKAITWPAMVAMVVANLANVVGNFILIWGDDGLRRLHLPLVGLRPLGVMGSGLSSSFASILSLLVLVAATRTVAAPPDPDRRRLDKALVRRIFALGGPVGLQLLAEVGVFAIVGVLAGRMSPQAAGAHQVALCLASFTFTVTIGIGAATSVRVGRWVGRDDAPAARRAGQLGLIASALFMALAGITFFLIPVPLARVITDDAQVIAGAVPLIFIAALFQLSDGTQSVAAGALRGAGDPRSPLVANVVGHYLIGLPIAIGLGLVAHLGAPGLWWGLSTGLTAVAVWLTVRFLRLSSRPIRRV